MRTIDMQTWSRREHFQVFNAFDHPHVAMCANVNLTTFLPVVKQSGYSINVAIVYVISRASNAIPEFRYRIRVGSFQRRAHRERMFFLVSQRPPRALR